MIESYDIRTRNPYGDKLATKLLNNEGGFKAVSLAIPACGELADHTAPSPAMLFALEGDALFIAGTEEIRLLPGTVVHIPPGVPHRVVAAENSQLLLVR